MQLARSYGLFPFLIWLASSIAWSKTYTKEPIASTIAIESSFLSLEQADGEFERRLAFGANYSRPVWQNLRLLGQLNISPDQSKDTGDTSVFQSFYSLGTLIEYSTISLLKFYVNFGPSLLVQRVVYQFKGDREAFIHYGECWDLNLGAEYMAANGYFIRYSIGRRWRSSDARLDKTQSLGVVIAI